LSENIRIYISIQKYTFQGFGGKYKLDISCNLEMSYGNFVSGCNTDLG